MRTLDLAIVALLGIGATPALAQTPAATDAAAGARPGNVIGTGSSLPRSDQASNITPADTRSIIAPNLPSPPLGGDATPRDYLTSARASLAAGRTGQAQQALEMAETRALDRSVLQSQSDQQSGNRFVLQIAEARRALGDGNREQAVQFINGALSQ
jgi:hypothetical protein